MQQVVMADGNEHMDVLKRQLLINIFDILARQGLLTEEETYRLKIELVEERID